MKIVNLNEYNEGEGLRNKLRPKIDNFEPELPASLWDRIHHEMDVRESNRKRKAVWWFSSVAVVILASGIISFLLVNNASRPIELVIHQPQVEGTAKNGTDKVLPQNPANTETNTGINTPTSPTTNKNGGKGIISSSNLEANNAPNESLNAAPSVETIAPLLEEPSYYTKGTIMDGGTMEMKPGKLPIVFPIHEIVVVDLPKTPVKSITPTKVRRFFVGAYGEYNQTYRTAVTTGRLPGYPTAEERSRFENKGYSPSYGIEFGYFLHKNVFVKTGVGMFSITESVRYDITKVTGGIVFAQDSLVAGTSHKTTNNYSYVQIPLEIGYSHKLGQRLGILLGGGASLNILKDYNYNFYDPIYGSEFIKYSKASSGYFNNFISLSGNAGLFYSLTKNWQLTGGVMYRRAITSAAPKEFGVNIKPWSVGSRVALIYKF